MADEKPSLHIDTDWKKQAQDEKKKLAEQAAAPKPPPATLSPTLGEFGGGIGPASPSADPAARGESARTPRGRREVPAPSFATLVQSLLTQSLFYMGELSQGGAEPAINLDLAKHQLDTLGMIEQKTANNLTADEQHFLDSALYEARGRFVSVASQFV